VREISNLWSTVTESSLSGFLFLFSRNIRCSAHRNVAKVWYSNDINRLNLCFFPSLSSLFITPPHSNLHYYYYYYYYYYYSVLLLDLVFVLLNLLRLFLLIASLSTPFLSSYLPHYFIALPPPFPPNLIFSVLVYSASNGNKY
jgi:hypothetical protein